MVEGAVRTSLITLAVCIGVALGIRTRPLSADLGQLRPRTPRSGSVVSCERVTRADYDPPAGYALVGITRSASGSYARLADKEPSQPTSEMGSGAAELFDSDGRLLMRYQAIEGADFQWSVTEDVHMPLPEGSPGNAGK